MKNLHNNIIEKAEFSIFNDLIDHVTETNERLTKQFSEYCSINHRHLHIATLQRLIMHYKKT